MLCVPASVMWSGACSACALSLLSEGMLLNNTVSYSTSMKTNKRVGRENHSWSSSLLIKSNINPTLNLILFQHRRMNKKKCLIFHSYSSKVDTGHMMKQDWVFVSNVRGTVTKVLNQQNEDDMTLQSICVCVFTSVMWPSMINLQPLLFL